MRRPAALLAAITLGLGVGACGNEGESGGDASGGPGNNPSNVQTSETQPTTLGSTVPNPPAVSQEQSPPATTEPTPAGDGHRRGEE